jgi:phosphonoacetate hydrolase
LKRRQLLSLPFALPSIRLSVRSRKTQARDLEKACANHDAPVRLAISAERDKYPKHHLGLGGVAWIYLRRPADEQRVASVIEKLEGVEQVLTRDDAA